jgi:hypothetical protein
LATKVHISQNAQAAPILCLPDASCFVICAGQQVLAILRQADSPHGPFMQLAAVQLLLISAAERNQTANTTNITVQLQPVLAGVLSSCLAVCAASGNWVAVPEIYNPPMASCCHCNHVAFNSNTSCHGISILLSRCCFPLVLQVICYCVSSCHAVSYWYRKIQHMFDSLLQPGSSLQRS